MVHIATLLLKSRFFAQNVEIFLEWGEKIHFMQDEF